MTSLLLPVIVGALIVGLFVWLIVRQRAQVRAERAALERFGFRPCPDKQSWLDETVARLESNSRYTPSPSTIRCSSITIPRCITTRRLARGSCIRPRTIR